MEITLPTYVLGPIFLIILFLLCTVFTLGVKMLIMYFTPNYEKKKIPVTATHKKRRKKRTAKVAPIADTPPAVRSVEIDPTQVDRIYVKKIS